MIIAHLPAGYLWTRGWLALLKKRVPSTKQRLWLLIAGLVGSIAPDFDMIYFHLIDNRQHNHHTYWTHTPFWWLLISGLILWAARWSKQPSRFRLLAGAFFGSVFLHLVLDTVAGGIRWAYPFSTEMSVFLTVAPRYDWWVWNFLLHTSFLIELAIVVGACILWLRTQKKAREHSEETEAPRAEPTTETGPRTHGL